MTVQRDALRKVIRKGDTLVCVDSSKIEDLITIGRTYINDSNIAVLIVDDTGRRGLFQPDRFVVDNNSACAIMSLLLYLRKRDSQLKDLIDAYYSENENEIEEAMILVGRDFVDGAPWND
jgi:hypothetical protein